jgi:hypothetical protein
VRDNGSVILRYLYVGSSDTSRDLATWSGLPGAKVRWRFQHFGADVAAIDLGSPPVILLADHRPPGSILPIYAVDDLKSAVTALERQGWTVHDRSFGTPEGPAALLSDQSATQLALLQVDRPKAMETAYDDERNTHAVRPSGPATSV